MSEDEDEDEDDSDVSAAGMILDGMIDQETGEWTDDVFEEDEDEDDGEF
jgi:hypothetical protein